MVRPSMQGLIGWIVEIKKTHRSRGHGQQVVEDNGKGKAKASGFENAMEDKDALAAIERERSST